MLGKGAKARRERGEITDHQHAGTRLEHGHGAAGEGELHTLGQAHSPQIERRDPCS
jgi:hypothetical protein